MSYLREAEDAFGARDERLLTPAEHEFVKFLAFVHADAYGRGLGIDATSPAFGPLTCNPGVIRVVDGHIEQVIDVRFPDSTSADTIREQLEPLVGRFDVTCRLGHAKVPFSVSADDPAVKALIDTYNEFTGKHAEPFAMGGGTYARNFARASSSILCSGCPTRLTSPLLPSSSPARIASKVDLPDPDSPTSAMVSPRLTTSSTPVRMESSCSP